MASSSQFFGHSLGPFLGFPLGVFLVNNLTVNIMTCFITTQTPQTTFSTENKIRLKPYSRDFILLLFVTKVSDPPSNDWTLLSNPTFCVLYRISSCWIHLAKKEERLIGVRKRGRRLTRRKTFCVSSAMSVFSQMMSDRVLTKRKSLIV